MSGAGESRDQLGGPRCGQGGDGGLPPGCSMEGKMPGSGQVWMIDLTGFPMGAQVSRDTVAQNDTEVCGLPSLKLPPAPLPPCLLRFYGKRGGLEKRGGRNPGSLCR